MLLCFEHEVKMKNFLGLILNHIKCKILGLHRQIIIILRGTT